MALPRREPALSPDLNSIERLGTEMVCFLFFRLDGHKLPQKHPEVLENAVQAAPGAKSGAGFSYSSADFP